jgi:hypothetical protein
MDPLRKLRLETLRSELALRQREKSRVRAELSAPSTSPEKRRTAAIRHAILATDIETITIELESLRDTEE